MLFNLENMSPTQTAEIDVFSPQARGDRVRTARGLSGATQLELAEAASVSIATIRSWETGLHGGLTKPGADKLSRGLLKLGVNCSIMWLLSNAGPRPINISDTQSNVKRPSIPSQELEKELENFLSVHKSALSLIIEDETMFPFFLPGDCVMGPVFSQPNELKSLCGKQCIIETFEYGSLVRTVVDINEDMITLIASNISENDRNTILNKIKWSKIAPIILHRKPTPRPSED